MEEFPRCDVLLMAAAVADFRPAAPSATKIKKAAREVFDAPVTKDFAAGEDGTPPTFEILGTCPTQHFTRESAPRPPKPGEPSELEYIASRVFGT